MSSQLLLGIGVGLPLLAIGGYVAWLSRRVAELEERDGLPGPADETEEAAD